MSLHRCRCCGESSCYSSLSWYRCVQDGEPPENVISPLNAQVVSYQASGSRTTTSFGVTDTASFEARGIAGVAYGYTQPPTSADIRSVYGTDAFGPLEVFAAPNPVPQDNQIFGVFFRALTRTLVRADTLGFFYSSGIPTVTNTAAQVIPGTDQVAFNQGFRMSMNYADTPQRRCGRVDFSQDSFAIFTIAGIETSQQSSIQTASGPSSSSTATSSATISIVHPFTHYMPSYSGPRVICPPSSSIQSPQNPNQLAIDAANINNPLYTCKGCGQ